jgi:cellulose synthase/poly-beta-1,6-N-acetylglucosamine synthase-like glycosyltransferase
MQTNPYVSVVIPTYNRSTKLIRCLNSLFDQTYPKDQYEIIIINDGSKDDTENILKQFNERAPCTFLWVSQKNQGIATATNTGILRSKGDIICFTGDDCIAEKDWIENLVKGFVDDKVGAVGGNVIGYQTTNPIQLYSEDAQIVNQERFMIKNKLITGSAAYRREILTEIQGFDNHLNACVDVDVSIRTQLLGYRLNYAPDAVVYHDHPATTKNLISQQYRNGIGFVRLHQKYEIKYNLAYNTSIFGFRILVIILKYPFTLLSASISKKNKYFVLKPLYEVIRSSALTSGIIRETLIGKGYEGKHIQSNVDFIEFMDNKSIFFLWEKIKKKYLNNFQSFSYK